MIEQGKKFNEFDREASLELLANNPGHAPLQVRSVGTAGLRAGELDLWFESGRLSWLNNGRRVLGPGEPACGDSHSPVS